MKKEYKYFAFDLDGTLLNSNNEIPNETVNYLIKQKEKIILVSGRHYHQIVRFARILQLSESDYIICSDGLYIYNGIGKLIKRMNYLSVKDAYFLLKNGYDDLRIFTDSVNYYYKRKKKYFFQDNKVDH